MKIGEVIQHKKLLFNKPNDKQKDGEEGKKTLGFYQRQYEYCAPELFYDITSSSSPIAYLNRIDVYSMAVIFWEIIHRLLSGAYAKPFYEFEYAFSLQMVLQSSKRNVRPSLPATCPNPIADLIRKCWNKDPSMRPDLPSIKKSICIIEREFLLNIIQWNALLPKPLIAQCPSQS